MTFFQSALGSRRAMPVVGRNVHMITDLMRLADTELQRSFSISHSQNICFHGNCKLYCDIYHQVCGEKDMLEVSRMESIVYNL